MKKNAGQTKNAKEMKQKVRQESERFSDKAVLLSTFIILYVFLLMLLQRMSQSTLTVVGANAFTNILFGVSIAGAMICAAWAAYKERKGMLTYCGVFVFILWSTVVIKFCGHPASSAYALIYAGLAAAFVYIQVYYGLLAAGKANTKKSKLILWIVGGVIIAVFAAASILLYLKK